MPPVVTTTPPPTTPVDVTVAAALLLLLPPSMLQHLVAGEVIAAAAVSCRQLTCGGSLRSRLAAFRNVLTLLPTVDAEAVGSSGQRCCAVGIIVSGSCTPLEISSCCGGGGGAASSVVTGAPLSFSFSFSWLA